MPKTSQRKNSTKTGHSEKNKETVNNRNTVHSPNKILQKTKRTYIVLKGTYTQVTANQHTPEEIEKLNYHQLVARQRTAQTVTVIKGTCTKVENPKELSCDTEIETMTYWKWISQKRLSRGSHITVLKDTCIRVEPSQHDSNTTTEEIDYNTLCRRRVAEKKKQKIIRKSTTPSNRRHTKNPEKPTTPEAIQPKILGQNPATFFNKIDLSTNEVK